MLDSQIVVNLLLELSVGVNLVIHGNWLVKDSRVLRDSCHNGLGGIVDEPRWREGAPWPGEGTPKGGTHVLAVGATPGQLDHCVALALQQDGEQSTLRERKGRG
jgi:hypothetical protein